MVFKGFFEEKTDVNHIILRDISFLRYGAYLFATRTYGTEISQCETRRATDFTDTKYYTLFSIFEER